jgi:hypothetical protein
MDEGLTITRFCNAELRVYARSLRHRLRRLPAAGIFGDDYGHRSLWDEFEFEAENGPTAGLEWAWNGALSGVLCEVIDKLPEHHRCLLSWHLASLEGDEPEFCVNEDLLKDAVLSATRQLA